MKFIVVLAVFAAILAVALGIRPTPPRKCDYLCTKLDDTVCASNEICLNHFPSKCQMEKYNCLYPKKAFSQVEDWKCTEQALPQCSLGDL